MPYSDPSSPQPLPTHSLGRPGHRRSFSHNPNAHAFHGPTFSAERGAGTFAPMGALPRRPRAATVAHNKTTSSTQSPPASATKPKFSLKSSSSSGSSSDSEEEDKIHLGNIPPPLVLRQNHSFGLSLNTAFNLNLASKPPRANALSNAVAAAGIQRNHAGSPVPFPRSSSDSPLGSPSQSNVNLTPAGLPVLSPRPSYTRTSSSPIILSNGKPLKSSLKSSSSSPVINHGEHHHHHHLGHGRPLHTRTHSSPALQRARSASASSSSPLLLQEPTVTPSPRRSPLSSLSSSSRSSSASSDSDNNLPLEEETYYSDEEYIPPTPKAVHFPTEPTEIASVRLFSKRAKPASVSLPSVYLNGDGGDTETGSDSDNTTRWNSGMSNGYPFPRSPLSQASAASTERYVLNADTTSAVNPSAAYQEVRVEGLWLVHDSASPASTPTVSAAPSSIATPEFIANSTSSRSGGITLHGTLLLRNVAYAKSPAVRFTLDGWDTTSEVSARWVEGVSLDVGKITNIDEYIIKSQGRSAPPSHDRFAFSIHLDDYAAVGAGLMSRTLWLVARFTAPGVGEWWDNNSGRNYRVEFQAKTPEEAKASVPPAVTETSAPVSTSSLTFPTATEMEMSPQVPALFNLLENQPSSAPPSPSEHAQAIAAATTQALSKLNLKNYASPSPRSRLTSFSGPPIITNNNDLEKQKSKSIIPIASPPVTSTTNSPGWLSDATEKDSTPTGTPAVPSAKPSVAASVTQFGSAMNGNNSNDSIKLYWPWAQRSESPESITSPPTHVHSRVSSNSSTSTNDDDLPLPSLASDVGDDDEDAQALLSPLSPIDGVSAFLERDAVFAKTAADAEAEAAAAAGSDTLYQAFVQQWCFAQGPAVVRS